MYIEHIDPEGLLSRGIISVNVKVFKIIYRNVAVFGWVGFNAVFNNVSFTYGQPAVPGARFQY